MRKSSRRTLQCPQFNCWSLLTCCWFIVCATAQGEVDYGRDIKPLLAHKCISCHGLLKQEADLRLDAARLIPRGQSEQAVVVSGHPEQSKLIKRISSVSPDDRMPPPNEGEALTREEIGLLSEWIRTGMPAPANEEVLSSPAEHWAYQKIKRPEIPAVEGGQSSNPIDLFLQTKRQQLGLKNVPRTDPSTLLRRLSLDVIGLPPSLDQLESFTANDSPEAYAALVEQVLASPHYGERWGRHWMDVWRYSDWSGYKDALRDSQPHIWHWRDWIIESLNEDKSYDQMVVEMLAGDEIAPLDQNILRATGFLARNYHNSNRNIWLDSTVEHTAKAFLGMTINCARCHDHKFDPIVQQEYYTFRAIFEPHNVRTDRLPGVQETAKDGLARAFDKDLAAETYLYRGGDDRHPDKEHPLQADVVEILGIPFEIQPVELPVEGYFPALSRRVESEDLQQLEKTLQVEQAALLKFEPDSKPVINSPTQAGRPPAPERPTQIHAPQHLAILKHAAAKSRLESLQTRYAADRAKYQQVGNFAQLAPVAAQAERKANWLIAMQTSFQKWQTSAAAVASEEKDAAKRKAAIEKATKELSAAQADQQAKSVELQKSDSKYTAVGTVYPQQSSGRRLALANWIVNPENPLTARVAVNHIWLRHFGTPLVVDVFDFGMRSPAPVHQDLLDWLASELIASGWSMKHLHRLILLSETYQQASSATPELIAFNENLDHDNVYYWKFRVQRLESEVIRDSVLAVAGQLDLSQSGPDIDFTKGEEVLRRSVYFRHAYEKQMLMMTIFDAANPTDCYRRSPSIIPQQALALANSALSVSAARQLASQLSQSSPETSEFIRKSFQHVLSRSPAEEELRACEQFLKSQSELLKKSDTLTSISGKSKSTMQPAAKPEQRARENLLHVLLNHNDFISVR